MHWIVNVYSFKLVLLDFTALFLGFVIINFYYLKIAWWVPQALFLLIQITQELSDFRYCEDSLNENSSGAFIVFIPRVKLFLVLFFFKRNISIAS